MIKNNGSKKIETKRLLLRKFEKSDYVDFYNSIGSDEKVSRYVVWNKHENIDVTKSLIDKWVDDYKEDYTYRWVVVLKENNQIIGSISCVKLDIKNETCEIGYVYSSKYWNKGYGTEALKAVIDYLLEEGFHTIYAMHLSLNPASGKVMLKSGMVFEGVLKNRMIDKNTGKYDDILSYSISKTDTE